MCIFFNPPLYLLTPLKKQTGTYYTDRRTWLFFTYCMSWRMLMPVEQFTVWTNDHLFNQVPIAKPLGCFTILPPQQ